MGLVIFAPTPSFACEKMRLLLTRTHTVHSLTHALGRTRATVCMLFIDSIMLIFSLALLYFHYFPFSLLLFGICHSSRFGLCDCKATGILLD